MEPEHRVNQADHSVSVIVPAYNESQNLRSAVRSIVHAMSSVRWKYEILIVDDGSSDDTYVVAKEISRSNRSIRVLHLDYNAGLGGAYKYALTKARYQYVTVFPGDNDMSADSLCDLIRVAQQADLITSYPQSSSKRSWVRKNLSFIFIALMNIRYGMKLRYFNGPFICKTSLVRGLPLKQTGHTVFAEMKVRLLRQGATYREIQFVHTGRKRGHSKAISLFNIGQTLRLLTGI